MPAMLRRAGRTLSTILSAISLLLFVASFVLRLDLRDHASMLWCGSRTVFVIGVGSDGNAAIAFSSIPAEWTPVHAMPERFIWRTGGAMPIDRSLIPDALFAFWKRQEVFKLTTVLLFPFWTVQLACAVLPVAWIRTRVRRWRRSSATGLCGHCGYDLRATPDRCPECGTLRPTVGV